MFTVSLKCIAATYQAMEEVLLANVEIILNPLVIRSSTNMFCAVGEASILFCRAMMTFDYVS